MTARSSLVTKRALPDRSEDKDLAVKKAAELNGGSQPANAVDTKRTGEAEHLKRSSRLSIIRKKQEKPSSHVRHDVFEAHEALESGRFSKHWKRKKADDYLSNYYEERDIVRILNPSDSQHRANGTRYFLLIMQDQ